MNAANEKLCIGDWLKEYVNVLELNNKLDGTIKRLDPDIDLSTVGDSKAKKTLLVNLYKDTKNADEVNGLYFDYLCDRAVYHLL